MLVILLVGLLALTWYVREAIAPLVIAALLAYILDPIIEALQGFTRLKRKVAVSLTFFTALGLLIAIPAALFPILILQVEELISNLEDILRQVQEMASNPVVFMRWEFYLAALIPDMTDLFTTGLTSVSDNALAVIERVSKNTLWVLVSLISTFYLLMEWPKPWQWLLSSLPSMVQPDAERLYGEIKAVWRGYLRGNLTLMFVVGIVFTIAWLILGIPGALILGIIAGVLTIIPDLGPAIAAFLAIIVALFEGSTWLPVNHFWFGLIVFLVYMALINIKNIFLRPRIFGRAVHMHDGIVFVAIIVAVVVEGILGALIVVPLLASGAILVRYVYRRILNLPPWPTPPETPASDPQPPKTSSS
jgi:predicted PurR-regulated permease PerM